MRWCLKGSEAGQVTNYTKTVFVNYTALNGEKIFVLDAEDASNLAYGYSVTDNSAANKTKSGADASGWWLRSPYYDISSLAGFVYGDGGQISDHSVRGGSVGVSPAFNVNLESVIFSSVINPSSATDEDAKKWGNEYKLTLKDANTSVAANGEITNHNGKVTVPFTVTDSDSADNITADQVAVVITDADHNITLYQAQAVTLDNNTASGNLVFTLPEGFDFSTDTVSITAQDVNENTDKCLTDYASELVPLAVPKSDLTLEAAADLTYTGSLQALIDADSVPAGATVEYRVTAYDSEKMVSERDTALDYRDKFENNSALYNSLNGYYSAFYKLIKNAKKYDSAKESIERAITNFQSIDMTQYGDNTDAQAAYAFLKERLDGKTTDDAESFLNGFITISEWSSELPTGTNASTYTVDYKGTGIYSDEQKSLTASIAKADFDITVTAKEHIVYDGNPLELSDFTFTGKDAGLITADNTTVEFAPYSDKLGAGFNLKPDTVYYISNLKEYGSPLATDESSVAVEGFIKAYDLKKINEQIRYNGIEGCFYLDETNEVICEEKNGDIWEKKAYTDNGYHSTPYRDTGDDHRLACWQCNTYVLDGNAMYNIYCDDIIISPNTSAGTHAAYIVIESPDSNHNKLMLVVPVTIEKAPTLTQAPTTMTPKLYDEAVQLINAGTSVDGFTLWYALGTNDTTAPTNGWTTDPTTLTASEKGTYYVWYKIEGDDNYESVTECVPVTVSQMYTVTASEAAHGTVAANVTEMDDDAQDKTVTLTLTPDKGYQVRSVKVNGTAITPTDGAYTFTMPSKNVTVSAEFEPVTYSIEYVLNGGTNAATNPASYTIEDETIILADPTRTGYTFAGWVDAGANTVSGIAKGSTGDQKLTATWTLNEYSITYELDGGTNAATNPASYTIEDETIILADPTRTGYTFAGWVDAGGNTVSGIAKGSTGNQKLTATWTANSYKVTLPKNMMLDKTVLDAGKAKFGTEVSFKPMDGFVVIGAVSDGTHTLTAADGVYTFTMGAADVTISAVTGEFVPAVAPTCENDGNIAYYLGSDGKYYADTKGTVLESIINPKIGHSYGAPSWTWTSDFSSAQAAFTCGNCKDVQTVKAAITSEKTDATYEADGKIVYTATVTFGGKIYTDTKEVTIPQLVKTETEPTSETAPAQESSIAPESSTVAESSTAQESSIAPESSTSETKTTTVAPESSITPESSIVAESSTAQESSIAPESSTSETKTTTVAQESSTSESKTTTIAQEASTSESKTTTAPLESSTSETKTTTATQESSTSETKITTATASSDKPQETTETTATTAAPQTTTEPVATTVVPQTTTEPVATTAVPQTTTEPVATTATPQTTTEPAATTTETSRTETTATTTLSSTTETTATTAVSSETETTTTAESSTTETTMTTASTETAATTTTSEPITETTSTTTSETTTTVETTTTLPETRPSIELTVNTDEPNKVEAVFVPSENINERGELSLKTEDGMSVTFDPYAAQEIADAADGKEVSIKIETIDPEKTELPAEVKQAAENGAVILDLSLVDADGKKVAFTDGGSVTIEMPYTSENGEAPMVYCLMDDGKFYAIPTTYDPATQTISFNLNAQNTAPEAPTKTMGDADGNGSVDALDAAEILLYAAAQGAGETYENPAFVAELADTDGKGTIDAVDASNVLIYAAIAGAEGQADWTDVLGTKSEPTA